MNRYPLALVSAALLLAACGGKETMASKSAAAYREAQGKGIPVTEGHEHGHETGTSAAPMDHSTMDHSTIDHAAMEHGTTGHAAMDHSTMSHATMSHATTDHAAMDHSTMDHSAMQQGSTDHSAHAGHTMPSGPAPAIALHPPASNAEMARTSPAATLQPDAFDAPPAGVKKER